MDPSRSRAEPLNTHQRPPVPSPGSIGTITINGVAIDASFYFNYHRSRLLRTLACVREIGARRVMELGSHPWAMTSLLVDEPSVEVVATVSAEEVTPWPDDIGVRRAAYELVTSSGRRAAFPNYSANLERTRFPIDEQPDTVLACEIIEHLIRSPHVMLLNANDWLPVGGHLVMSTPNGAQLTNVLRRRPPMPGYRASVYERHAYLYTIDELADIVRLCGFDVLDIGYWDVYAPQGWAAVLAPLSRIPIGYVRDKTKRTIFVVAKKARSVVSLDRAPRCYDGRGAWEYIGEEDPSGRSRRPGQQQE